MLPSRRGKTSCARAAREQKGKLQLLIKLNGKD